MTTPLPFRLMIQDRLCQAFRQITPIAGYANDLSGPKQVWRGRAQFGKDDPLPLVSILEPPIPPDPSATDSINPTQESDWYLLIQGFVADDPLNPTDPAQVLMADVRKCLGTVKRNAQSDFSPNLLGLGPDSPDVRGTGNSVVDIIIGVGLCRPSDNVSAFAYFWLGLTIRLTENLTKPYGA